MPPRVHAALLLGAAVVVFAVSLVQSDGSWSAVQSAGKARDPEVYDRILARLRTGEAYYTVVGTELRANGYATLEIFNWRTPLLWRSLAPLPPALRRVSLMVLAVLAAVTATATAARRSRAAALVTAVTGSGVVFIMWTPAAVAMGEAWAGALIGLSVCAYVRGREWQGLAFGLAALFVRELAAPFAIICTLIAARRRRWREVAAWLTGGLAYAAYYALHLGEVWAHRSATDLPGAGSWISGGGLTFLLSTVQWNLLLFFAPWAFVAAALSLVVSGVSSPVAPAHVRWTAGVYAGMFLVVGQPFDRYWGYLTWPTWMLACGFGADALLTACRTLSASDTPPNRTGA